MKEMTLSDRCRAQARSMRDEGWYVCSNVLLQSADRIERLEFKVAELEAKVKLNSLGESSPRGGC
jgi:BMFP domain-containing protein YqiC